MLNKIQKIETVIKNLKNSKFKIKFKLLFTFSFRQKNRENIMMEFSSYICRLCSKSVNEEDSMPIYGSGGQVGAEIFLITGVRVRKFFNF